MQGMADKLLNEVQRKEQDNKRKEKNIAKKMFSHKKKQSIEEEVSKEGVS